MPGNVVDELFVQHRAARADLEIFRLLGLQVRIVLIPGCAKVDR